MTDDYEPNGPWRVGGTAMLKEDITARHSVLVNHGDWVELATGQDIWGADDAPVFHLADWYDSESLALVASAPTLLGDVASLRSQLATVTAERDAARRERDDAVEYGENAAKNRDAWNQDATRWWGMYVSARESLAGIRDRYVRRVPGKDRPMCTLCGADDSTHADDKNCGLAARALINIDAAVAAQAKPAAPPPTPPAGMPAPAVQGEPPRCREWCGTNGFTLDDDLWFLKADTGKKLSAVDAYCSEACRDAGKPTHHREGEPRDQALSGLRQGARGDTRGREALRYRGFTVYPGVVDRGSGGKLKPHRFEEAHDDPAPAPRCWFCLRLRAAKVHRPAPPEGPKEGP